MVNEKWLITRQVMADTTVMIISVLNVKTWDEYHQMTDAMFAEVRKIGGTVDIVLDTQDYPLPSNTPLVHFRKTMVLWRDYPQLKSVTVVARLPFLLEPFARMAFMAVGATGMFDYAQSRDAALLKIQKRYAST